MRKKRLTFVLLTCISLVLNGQNLIQTHFKANTKWISINVDSAFFKKDSIRIIQSIQNSRFSPDAFGLFKTDYLELNFHSGGKAQLLTYNGKSASIPLTTSNINWKINKRKDQLQLQEGQKVIAAFTAVDISSVKLQSKYYNQNDTTTTELRLVRVKTKKSATHQPEIKKSSAKKRKHRR